MGGLSCSWWGCFRQDGLLLALLNGVISVYFKNYRHLRMKKVNRSCLLKSITIEPD